MDLNNLEMKNRRPTPEFKFSLTTLCFKKNTLLKIDTHGLTELLVVRSVYRQWREEHCL